MVMVAFFSNSGPQGPQLQKVLERLTGQHTVPNVFIGKKGFLNDKYFVQLTVKCGELMLHDITKRI